jgi:putative transposase
VLLTSGYASYENPSCTGYRSLAVERAHGPLVHGELPSEGWMMQVARNLTDKFSGFLIGKSHLILNRDRKYTVQFRRLIAESRTAVIRLPPQSPNLNAYAERFVRSIKEECLGRMIFVGQASLRRAISEFVVHYHSERNHQGVENRLLRPGATLPVERARVQRRQRLGGMLNFYSGVASQISSGVSGQYGRGHD